MSSTAIRDPVADHLITPHNATMVLIDYQPSQFATVRSMDPELLLKNVVSTVKIARTFGVPIVHSTVGVAAGRGKPTVPALAELLEGSPPIDRTSINAWEDVDFVAAVRATGRRKLIVCALWTEVCMAFPALDALREGYEVYPVVDAIAGTSVEAHRAGLERVARAGGTPIGWVSLACELQRDWAREETVPDVVRIVLTERLLQEWAVARAAFEEALPICRACGYVDQVVFLLDDLGDLARLSGDREAARVRYREALRASLVFGAAVPTLVTLTRLAGLEAVAGSTACAARLVAACGAWLARTGRPASGHRDPWRYSSTYDRDLAGVRARVGEPGVAAAWAEGEAMPLEQAIADALEDATVQESGPGLGRWRIYRGLTNEPGRCPECRAARKSQRGEGGGGGGYAYSTGGGAGDGGGRGGGGYDRPRREMFPATCSSCGKETKVPFQPRGDKPVYCSECFESVRGGRGY